MSVLEPLQSIEENGNKNIKMLNAVAIWIQKSNECIPASAGAAYRVLFLLRRADKL